MPCPAYCADNNDNFWFGDKVGRGSTDACCLSILEPQYRDSWSFAPTSRNCIKHLLLLVASPDYLIRNYFILLDRQEGRSQPNAS